NSRALQTQNSVLQTSESALKESTALQPQNGIMQTSENILQTSENFMQTSENLRQTSENILQTSENFRQTSENILQTSKSEVANKVGYVNYCGQIVIEQTSKKALYAKNENIKMPMASTTKIVTCIVALENCDIKKTFTIPKEATNIEGSSIYLKEGEKLTIEELLYGLMLASGNDSAVAVAIAVGGSVQNFVAMMNDFAQKHNATNTHFANPNGLHNETHFTTAKDLAILTAHAMSNEKFCDIVATKSKNITGYDGYNRHLVNKNKMLTQFEGGNGVKTGFTKVAGRCLVSSAKRNGMQLISVVLNCPDMWQDSANNMTNAFKNYSMQQYVNANQLYNTVKTKKYKIGLAFEKDFYYPIKNGESGNFSYKIKIDDDFNKPQLNKIVGKLFIYDDNCLLFSANIYTINYEKLS
ncbi:MAG: D-alanyl-D-alanine carboxypeptidase family protein, partial [Clostridia bacterium]